MVRRPIELQPAAQPVPGALQQLVAARLEHEAVQFELGQDAGAVVAGIDAGQQRLVAPVQLGAEMRIPAVPHLLEGEDLERGAQRVDLTHVLDRKRRNVGARVGHCHQQAFLDQLAQRLAQRAAADVEARRQCRFGQRRTGLDVTGQDRGAQALGDVRTQRRLRHRADAARGDGKVGKSQLTPEVWPIVDCRQSSHARQSPARRHDFGQRIDRDQARLHRRLLTRDPRAPRKLAAEQARRVAARHDDEDFQGT